jgi:hypothetical protein
MVIWVEVDVKTVLCRFGIADRDEADSRVPVRVCTDDHLVGGLVQDVVSQHLCPPVRELGRIVGIDDHLIEANGHGRSVLQRDPRCTAWPS